jgi:phosphoglycolate phosphatase-like HAD superfamily hydrolase
MSDSLEPDWRPKAVLFDLLTALLDSWSLWSSTLITLQHPSPSSKALAWRTRYLELTFDCGAYIPYEAIVTQAAEDVGLPGYAGDVLREKWAELEPWSEVKDVLGRLREKGYRLGVVTNCSRELGSVAAERVGVGFNAVVTAEEAG